MEKRLEPPTINTKKELHNIYESVFKSSLPMTKKERILNSIFGYESWSWRVVGISKKALDVLKIMNLNINQVYFKEIITFNLDILQ